MVDSQQYFCCSNFDWHRDDVSYQPQADLDNAIHPLFQSDKFTNVSADEYRDLFTIIARLLTKLVLSDALVTYILTMADGAVFHDGYRRKNGKKFGLKRGRKVRDMKELDALNRYIVPKDIWILRYPKKEDKNVDDRTRAKARAILLDLVPMIEFEVKEADTFTASPLDGPLPRPLSDRFPRGCCTVITIPQSDLDDLRKAQAEGDYEGILKERLNMITCIMHEIGHALSSAIDGDLLTEPFYKSSPYSECGLALEGALFGGTIGYLEWRCRKPCGRCFDPEAEEDPDSFAVGCDPFCLRQYPSDVRAKDYETSDGKFAQRYRVTPQCEKVHKVPGSWVADLSTKRFWNEVVPTLPAGPLRPPTAGSWVIQYDPVGEDDPTYRMCEIDDPKLLRSSYIWLSGIIRREQRDGPDAQNLAFPLHNTAGLRTAMQDLSLDTAWTSTKPKSKRPNAGTRRAKSQCRHKA